MVPQPRRGAWQGALGRGAHCHTTPSTPQCQRIPHFSCHETSVALLRADTVLLLKRLQLFLHFCEMLFILLYMQANQFQESLLGQSSSPDLLQRLNAFM